MDETKLELGIFEPINPEAEERIKLLGEYEADRPEVIEVMRQLSPEDHALIMDFSPIAARDRDLQSYSIGLVVGYHLRDPERKAEIAQQAVKDELDRANKYYLLYSSLPAFPFLAGYQKNDGQLSLIWLLSDNPSQRTGRLYKADLLRRNLGNIYKALADPQQCENMFHDIIEHYRESDYVAESFDD